MRPWHLPPLLLLLLASLAQAEPGKLEYLSEVSPPFNFSDEQGQATGLSVELLQMIWKARGVAPQPIRILPWARGYNLLQQQPNVVLFATARTPQREPLFKWACPIDHSEFVLLGRKADNITLGSEAEISHYKVGVVRSTVSKQLLLDRGIDERNLMLANRLTQAAKMLTSGRATLFATNKLVGYQTLLQLGFKPDDFNVAFVLDAKPLCYAFSRQVPDSEIALFQQALTHVVASPEFVTLQAKYLPMH
ncbi:substrate-binding periplasmic protein [Aeromonas finlandensis]|uniref:substrate-binding periplasmic protein n=1 Tax=Aeromonas finlandensis TaxID=1543375 RepID=UPI00051B7C0C|nr:transporter substrate-binding domain-containing protein [Aeromonas finlandensis]